jgi:predicted DNA-binding transcriptional regulator AlpA
MSQPIRKPLRGHLDKTEIAEYLGISRPTVYTALKQGRILMSDTEIVYWPAKLGRKKASR